MASLKVKFRLSSVEGKEGTLYYQIIHDRTVRQIRTGYGIFPHEWDPVSTEIVFTSQEGKRREYLIAVQENVKRDLNRLARIIFSLERKGAFYTTDDIVTCFRNHSREDFLFTFMRNVINLLKQQGKIRTSETYTTTLNSFMRFRGDKDILMEEIDSDLIVSYEAYLKEREATLNTISFYMRILRAVYNRAVEKEFTIQRYPFKHVYTGVEKTVKRAIPLKVIKDIKEMDLSLFPSLDYARDMFLFSFYTRGMSFVDMAYLKKKNLRDGILSYRRKKTGQQLFIRWESCMQEIIGKYPTNDSPYLLPIIKKPGMNERAQYKNALYLVNRKLKEIAKRLGLSIPLTMYVARHSWASIAKSKNIPVAVISEGMGHDSESTTLIYLASLDTAVVDKANQLILKLL